jgi:hypothetical protein
MLNPKTKEEYFKLLKDNDKTNEFCYLKNDLTNDTYINSMLNSNRNRYTDIQTSDDGSLATTVEFNSPVFLENEKEYEIDGDISYRFDHSIMRLNTDTTFSIVSGPAAVSA